MRSAPLRSRLQNRAQLRQILLRLLDNAVKYTDAPGTISLIVSCVSETDGVRTFGFAVSDTGKEIDAKILQSFFDRSSQEEADRGLTLAAAKEMAERMGGSITAESRKGEGSVFTVTLPLACAPDEASD